MAKHGRTWRADRGGCSCDHRRSLSRARARDTASGARVTPQPSPIELTVSGQRLSLAQGGHMKGTDDTQKNPLNLIKRSVKPSGSSKQNNQQRKIEVPLPPAFRGLHNRLAAIGE